MRFLLVAAALLASAAFAQADLVSGRYGPLTLVVRNGAVSGVFFAERDGAGAPDAPQFSCVFLLRGRLANGKAAIETWYPGAPEPIPGMLAFAGADATLTLKENQDGCPMAIGDMVGEPFAESLDRPGETWVGVGLVTAERAVLYPRPELSAARKPYLIRLDAVAVRERKEDWAHVEFLNGENPVSGWLRASDVEMEPPTGR